MKSKIWNVYLAGEIHSNWRDEICDVAEKEALPAVFLHPELNHAVSDSCGADILGPEENDFWYDHKAAKINAIRNRGLLRHSDIVIVKFGEQYKQWNAAFDAGYAAALGKPLIVIHSEKLNHALKEIDAEARAVVSKSSQVVEILKHIAR